MDRMSIPLGDGHKASRRRDRCTNRHGKHLTQFYVLIISEEEDDVGSHVAHIAIPLLTRPEAISRQVSRALGHGEDSRQD